MHQSLYKYMPLQSDDHLGRLERILTGQIYFSSPAFFNDPFEMSALAAPLERQAFDAKLADAGCLPTSASQRRAVHRRYRQALQATASPALARNWIDALGVLCLTTQKCDLLMWAHYAGNHSGICIGFDAGYAPFREAKPVQYSRSRPRVSLDGRRDDDHLVQSTLLTKSEHWDYENEWRVIKRPIFDDEKQYYQSLIAGNPASADAVAELLASQGGSGQYDFDPQAIRVICLGARLPASYRARVEAMLERYGPQVRIENMVLDDRYYQLHATRRGR